MAMAGKNSPKKIKRKDVFDILMVTVGVVMTIVITITLAVLESQDADKQEEQIRLQTESLEELTDLNSKILEQDYVLGNLSQAILALTNLTLEVQQYQLQTLLVQEQLLSSSNEILGTQTQLLNSSNEILNTQTQLLASSNEIANSQTELLASSNDVLASQIELQELQATLDSNQKYIAISEAFGDQTSTLQMFDSNDAAVCRIRFRYYSPPENCPQQEQQGNNVCELLVNVGFPSSYSCDSGAFCNDPDDHTEQYNNHSCFTFGRRCCPDSDCATHKAFDYKISTTRTTHLSVDPGDGYVDCFNYEILQAGHGGVGAFLEQGQTYLTTGPLYESGHITIECLFFSDFTFEVSTPAVSPTQCGFIGTF